LERAPGRPDNDTGGVRPSGAGQRWRPAWVKVGRDFVTRRYILTGAPGSGKTSILQALQRRGYDVVPEAATTVITEEQAAGIGRPWEQPDFIDKIVNLQRRRAADHPGAGIQIFDRSPVCTLALSLHLGYQVSAELSAEIGRTTRQRVYQRRVFFVRDLGFIESTPVRRISYEESLKFERVHIETYQALGFELVYVPKAGVDARADLIEPYFACWE